MQARNITRSALLSSAPSGFWSIVFRCAFVALASSVLQPTFAQGDPPIRNLGGDVSYLGEDWLVYSLWETFGGEDLNGDGDTEDSVVHLHNFPAGETTNLRLAGPGDHDRVSGDWLVLSVSESGQGEDLNGDGDTEDIVVRVHNLSTGKTTNLRLAITWNGAEWNGAEVSGDWLVFSVSEAGQGEDLNGDEDTEDNVVHVHNLSTSETTNLRLDAYRSGVSGDWLVLSVSESGQSKDLNGDGDTRDNVAHLHNLPSDETTNLRLALGSLVGPTFSLSADLLLLKVSEFRQGEDLNGDGDTVDVVVHVYNLSTGVTTNLRLSNDWIGEKISGDWLVLPVSEAGQGEDLNGDEDTEDNDVVHVHNLSTGVTTNLRLVGHGYFSGDWLVLSVREDAQGEDLNGDGDTLDWVAHVHNLLTGETTNLRALNGSVSGDLMVLSVSEAWEGEDLNGDEDTEDDVVHVHNLSTGVTTNLRLAGRGYFSGNWLVLSVREDAQGEDLNGDGDTLDEVAHPHNLSTGETTNLRLSCDFQLGVKVSTPTGYTDGVLGNLLVLPVVERTQGEDLNGDGDTEDRVVHVHNLSTGETTNLRLAGAIAPSALSSEDWLAIGVCESGGNTGFLFGCDADTSGQDEDLNGDGDTKDEVYHLVDLSRHHEIRPDFRRGDCNDDGGVDISDAVSTLGSLFLGEGEFGCDDACDSNDDGTVDISDAINTLGVLFLGNGTIRLPGMTECGVDPTDDALGCAETWCP